MTERFAIRRDALWKLPLLIIGATEEKSFVELRDDHLHVRFGVAHLSIPYGDIAAVKPIDWPLLYGIGIRIAPKKTFGLVGSRHGVVEIALRDPRPIKMVVSLTMERLAVSVDDPEGLVRAIEARRG